MNPAPLAAWGNRPGGSGRRWSVTSALLLLTTAQALAQEPIRLSLASAAAVEARRRARSSLDYYNLKLGPTAWRFGAGLGVEYNSNVNNTEDEAEGDAIFRPQINTQMLWPLTDQNSLNLRAGVGYSAYATHSELDRIFITPGSEVSFDLYAGDFWFNFHDRFSITEDTYADPTVAGTGGYSRLENDLGLSALWDLNKAILRFGYDHVNYVSLNQSQGQPDAQSEVVSSSIGFLLKPTTTAGLEVGGSLITYAESDTNSPYSNADQWNVGAFYDTQLTEYIKFRGSAGYTAYLPEAGTSAASDDFSGLYFQLLINHRLNRQIDYSLSAGRSVTFAYAGGVVDLYFARLNANWNAFRDIVLSTSLDFNHGQQGYWQTENFDQYGLGLNLGRPLTKKLSGGLGYHFYERLSDLEGRSYFVNVVRLNFNYRF